MKKTVTKYRKNKEYSYSCSEAIIHAADEKYNLNLSENEFKMMAPFSGGMYEGDACGILTASISVLGIILTNTMSKDSPILKQAVLEYKNNFKTIYGSYKCEDLVLKYKDDIVGCDDLIINASILLEETIGKYGKQN